MQSALEQFRVSIARVRDMIALHTSLTAQATSALDLSDILRAAIVLTVSALDYYVHEVVTLGMLDIYHGQRSEPLAPSNTAQSAFSRFKVSLNGARAERKIASDTVGGLQNVTNWLMSELQQSNNISPLFAVAILLNELTNESNSALTKARWLEDEIREQFSYKSFQQPDKIADAIRLISDKRLWDEVAQRLARPAKDIKQELSTIVDRRNKIAHEADIDPTYGIGDRWSIDETLVNDAVDFIEDVVESIHSVL